MEPLFKSFMRVILVVLLLYGVMLAVLYASEKPSGVHSKASSRHDVEAGSIGDVDTPETRSPDQPAPASSERAGATIAGLAPAAAAARPAVARIETAYSEVLLRRPQQQGDHFVATASGDATAVWRDEASDQNDRIIGQMRIRPASADRAGGTKLIFVPTGLGGTPEGRDEMLRNKCPVSECELTSDGRRQGEAHVVLWQNHFVPLPGPRPPRQIWAVFFLESPYHTPSLGGARGLVNWTATYRHDSTVVAPYERFTPYNSSVSSRPQARSYAAGKTKMVAWFVSNCGARNGRLEYARELSNHVGVDIYGACGSHRCDRGHADDCFKLLSKDYKFYLSFENSNCRDYITEKFFLNGLMNDILPIVMGAHPDDYKRAAPPHSYIHVDEFESPAALAAYLHKLDKDDELYNAYFAWKGTGANINTFFWCRMCAMAHAADSHPPTWIDDVEEWWRGAGVCASQEGNQLWPRWIK